MADTQLMKPATQHHVKRAIAAHMECEAAQRDAVRKGIECGENLAWLKSKNDHGQWESFFRQHFLFSDRTARRYMQMFENKDRLLALLDEVGRPLTVNMALRLLTHPEETEDVKAGAIIDAFNPAKPLPRVVGFQSICDPSMLDDQKFDPDRDDPSEDGGKDDSFASVAVASGFRNLMEWGIIPPTEGVKVKVDRSRQSMYLIGNSRGKIASREILLANTAGLWLAMIACGDAPQIEEPIKPSTLRRFAEEKIAEHGNDMLGHVAIAA